MVSRLEERRWHVAVAHGEPAQASASLDAILALEARRFGDGLATPGAALDPVPETGPVDLAVDLTGSASAANTPVLTLSFSGQPSYAAGVTRMLATRDLPELIARLDGVAVARARPMISDRLWLSRASTELLAGAISLVEHCVARFTLGQLTPLDDAPSTPKAENRGFVLPYLSNLVPQVAGRLRSKLAATRPFYWQTGIRPLPEAGDVAHSGRMEGAAFATLRDDGSVFYADPFLVAHGGRPYLFVEAFPYATGRGVVAVAEQGSEGQFQTPRVVLEESYHLSYPQVFAHDGEMFMLPEGGAGRELVLYRATAFPDAWVRDTVLLDNHEIGDATLLVRDGRYWLFATERFGVGSISDTMVIYSSDSLRGPYQPHPLNPIVVDRAAARPGGAFIAIDGRTYLPVQDGTESYGGGLGLVELVELDEAHVRFGPVRPIEPGSACPRPIHTLNAAAGFEAVDWSA